MSDSEMTDEFICYECQDGHHDQCIGVPCMCSCPVPDGWDGSVEYSREQYEQAMAFESQRGTPTFHIACAEFAAWAIEPGARGDLKEFRERLLAMADAIKNNKQHEQEERKEDGPGQPTG